MFGRAWKAGGGAGEFTAEQGGLSAWGQEEGVLCVCLEGISGSLVGPKLEEKRGIREAGGYQSSHGHSAPILQGLAFDLLD